MARSLLTILITVACTVAGAADAPSKPNVIVILTDDQGSVDAGC